MINIQWVKEEKFFSCGPVSKSRATLYVFVVCKKAFIFCITICYNYMFQIIKQIFIFDKKSVQTYLVLCEKAIAP